MRKLLLLLLVLAFPVEAAKYMPVKMAGGGGGSCGTISTAVTASRITGRAPLAVFFDASGTTDTGITKPYHYLRYAWGFSDTAGGATWSTGSNPGVNSKNVAYGPNVGHVFESAGTYPITMTAFDGTNTCPNTTLTVTVTNPDTTFSGTNTLCVGNSLPTAGSGGCPTGSAVLASSNFSTAISGNIASGKRILFNKGDTFTSGAAVNITVTGPITIGAYGTGAKPIVNGTAGSQILAPGGASFPNNTANLKDLVVMDLDLRGGGGRELVGPQGNYNQMTFLRIDGSDCGDGCIMFNGDLLQFWNSDGNGAHHTHQVWNELAIVDSTFVRPSTWTLYLYANKFMVAGNTIDSQLQGSHTYRMPYAASGYISNNTIQRNGPGSAGTHVLKIHAPPFAGDNLFPASTYSEKIVIGNNYFQPGNDANNDWTVALSPQDDTENERLRNIIFESNVHVAGTNTSFGIETQSTDITLRNNLHISTGAPQGTFIAIDRRSAAAGSPSGVEIYNNSMYSGTNNLNNTDQPFIDITSTVAAGSIVKNNLGYAPSSGTANLLRCQSTCTTGNNSASLGTNPNFTTTPPTSTISTWKPTSGYAVGGGASVPVWYDILGVGWQPTWDVGAVKH